MKSCSRIALMKRRKVLISIPWNAILIFTGTFRTISNARDEMKSLLDSEAIQNAFQVSHAANLVDFCRE